MKRFSLSVLLFAIIVSFTGCSSSTYVYNVKPTPIKQGVSKYSIRNIDLKLVEGEGKNVENKTYISESELKNSFKAFIDKALLEKSMLADAASLQLDIDINYTRVYNYGGNTLNKPEFVYTVKVYNADNVLLATATIPKSTTFYGRFKDMAVNLEIATFQWDAEDEPQDVELISKTLVRELSEIGS